MGDQQQLGKKVWRLGCKTGGRRGLSIHVTKQVKYSPLYFYLCLKSIGGVKVTVAKWRQLGGREG